jgi:hypothetical protein
MQCTWNTTFDRKIILLTPVLHANNNGVQNIYENFGLIKEHKFKVTVLIKYQNMNFSPCGAWITVRDFAEI